MRPDMSKNGSLRRWPYVTITRINPRTERHSFTLNPRHMSPPAINSKKGNINPRIHKNQTGIQVS